MPAGFEQNFLRVRKEVWRGDHGTREGRISRDRVGGGCHQGKCLRTSASFLRTQMGSDAIPLPLSCHLNVLFLSLVCQGLGGVSWPGEQQRPLIGRSLSVSHTQGRALSTFPLTARSPLSQGSQPCPSQLLLRTGHLGPREKASPFPSTIPPCSSVCSPGRSCLLTRVQSHPGGMSLPWFHCDPVSFTQAWVRVGAGLQGGRGCEVLPLPGRAKSAKVHLSQKWEWAKDRS